MTKPIKILIVDDEPKIVEVVKSYLVHSGYEVLTAYTGAQAMDLFIKDNPSLLILDLMLPDMSGEDICKAIRKESGVPIIMLTARVDEEDILRGLDIGADDYVLKPFSPRQLIARVAAVLRRVTSDNSPSTTEILVNGGELIIDDFKHEVRKKGNIINLTPNEYKILLAMIKHKNKTFTREELISIALGNDYEGFDRTVDTHVKNLRQKIEDDPKEPKLLLTVHGVGYKLNRQ